MAYKNMKQNKQHVKALHAKDIRKHKREKRAREYYKFYDNLFHEQAVFKL